MSDKLSVLSVRENGGVEEGQGNEAKSGNIYLWLSFASSLFVIALTLAEPHILRAWDGHQQRQETLQSESLLQDEVLQGESKYSQETQEVRIERYTQAAQNSLESAISCANQLDSHEACRHLENYYTYCSRACLGVDKESVDAVFKKLGL